MRMPAHECDHKTAQHGARGAPATAPRAGRVRQPGDSALISLYNAAIHEETTFVVRLAQLDFYRSQGRMRLEAYNKAHGTTLVQAHAAAEKVKVLRLAIKHDSEGKPGLAWQLVDLYQRRLAGKKLDILFERAARAAGETQPRRGRDLGEQGCQASKRGESQERRALPHDAEAGVGCRILASGGGERLAREAERGDS